MSLFYQLVFGLLVAEALSILVLLSPMPLGWRSGLFRFISRSETLSKVRYTLNIVLIFVGLLLADSLNKVNKVRQETREAHSGNHAHDARSDAFLHAKMFYAQRNVYLTGSCIFFALILNRFYHMVLDLLKNEEKAEVLRQQASKASKEYMKLLDGDEAQTELIKDLKEQLSEAEKRVRDADVMKKQAERTSKGVPCTTDTLLLNSRRSFTSINIQNTWT